MTLLCPRVSAPTSRGLLRRIASRRRARRPARRRTTSLIAATVASWSASGSRLTQTSAGVDIDELIARDRASDVRADVVHARNAPAVRGSRRGDLRHARVGRPGLAAEADEHVAVLERGDRRRRQERQHGEAASDAGAARPSAPPAGCARKRAERAVVDRRQPRAAAGTRAGRAAGVEKSRRLRPASASARPSVAAATATA